MERKRVLITSLEHYITCHVASDQILHNIVQYFMLSSLICLQAMLFVDLNKNSDAFPKRSTFSGVIRWQEASITAELVKSALYFYRHVKGKLLFILIISKKSNLQEKLFHLIANLPRRFYENFTLFVKIEVRMTFL
jgi:hypothetical protein